MKKRVFTGAGTALITPFNEDLTVNYNKLTQLVNEQIDKGIDSLVVCGTTGEPVTMTTEEKLETIKCAVKTSNGRIPIIAGTGGNNTKQVIEYSKKVERLGVYLYISTSKLQLFTRNC